MHVARHVRLLRVCVMRPPYLTVRGLAGVSCVPHVHAHVHVHVVVVLCVCVCVCYNTVRSLLARSSVVRLYDGMVVKRIIILSYGEISE